MNEVQDNAAAQFLLVMRQYMESHSVQISGPTITSVQSNDDKVSTLLKDSFIDSFPDRDQSFIERKTGGLVIWRSGTSVSIYIGVTYEDPILKLKKRIFTKNEIFTASDNAGQYSSEFDPSGDTDGPRESVGGDMEDKSTEAPSVVKYEDEVEELLDCLGPRYTDWPGEGPLPIDVDLLPGVIPGFQPPFRLLPCGVRLTVGTKEANALRRLARVLPPHFALVCRNNQKPILQPISI